MKRYEAYKPSGVSWITAIPSNWTVIKNRLLFTESLELSETGEETLLSLSQYTGVTCKTDAAKSGMREAESKAGYRIVHKDDIVMNIMLAWNGSTAASSYEGIISPAYAVYKLNTASNPWYFHYLFRTPTACSYFEANSTGLIRSRLRLYSENFLRLFSLVPPRAEQDQIVRYLDWQVSKINQLIAAKRKEVALLKEHKIATINYAVTRGIRCNVPLIQSGYNWLPYIPENWEPIPAKAVFRNITEPRHPDDPMLAATQKYGLIEQTEYMRLEGRRIVLANDNLDKWLHTEPNDFIISLRSFQGGLEMCEKPGCVTWHYVVLRPQRDVYPDFYKWFFKSASYIGALQKTSDFIRDGQDLRYSNFAKVGLFVIPIDEQKEIAEYLNREVPKYDVAIEKLETQVTKIVEYRTRLISDVVTGQVDVRGIEVPDFQMTQLISTDNTLNEKDYFDDEEREVDQ